MKNITLSQAIAVTLCALFVVFQGAISERIGRDNTTKMVILLFGSIVIAKFVVQKVQKYRRRS